MLRILAIVAALLPSAAVAQDAPQAGRELLTIVPDRLFAETRIGKAIEARIDQRTDDLVAENRRIESDLETEERDLTRQRDTLPTAQFRPLADAFDEKAERTRTEQDGKSRRLVRLRENYRQAFLKAAVPVLAEMMEDEGAVAILDRSNVFLSFDQVDVTTAAIARLDDAMGDGTAILDAVDAQ